jgi:hypothetical protein
MRRYTVAYIVYLTVYIAARLAIIDAIAVADIEAVLRAIPPDCMLDEPRKRPWEGRVELPGVNVPRDAFNDAGAAARPVAGHAVGVVCTEPMEDPGPDQEIVHQGVDGNHAGADLDPEWPIFRCGQQDAGQRHGQDLVGDAVDLSEWPNQGFPEVGEPIGAGRIIGRLEAPVDPAHQVAIGNIPDEQEQRIGHLVEPTVPQIMGGQRACLEYDLAPHRSR